MTHSPGVLGPRGLRELRVPPRARAALVPGMTRPVGKRMRLSVSSGHQRPLTAPCNGYPALRPSSTRGGRAAPQIRRWGLLDGRETRQAGISGRAACRRRPGRANGGRRRSAHGRRRRLPLIADQRLGGGEDPPSGRLWRSSRRSAARPSEPRDAPRAGCPVSSAPRRSCRGTPLPIPGGRPVVGLRAAGVRRSAAPARRIARTPVARGRREDS